MSFRCVPIFDQSYVTTSFSPFHYVDVGGGSVRNGTRHALSRISLRWMVRECFKTRTGILFRVQALREIGMDIDGLHPHVCPRPVACLNTEALKIRHINEELTNQTDETQGQGQLTMTEEEEDLHDALSPAHDRLQISRGWWVLEMLPRTHKYMLSNGSVSKYRQVLSANNGFILLISHCLSKLSAYRTWENHALSLARTAVF